jgi:spore germination protein GerM
VTRRQFLALGAGVGLLGALAWLVMWGVEWLTAPPESAETVIESTAPPPGVPRITATLFYGSEDGLTLVPVRREVALAEGVVPQAREILAAQFQPAPAPYVSLIPPGTTLRAFYATERGDAFVDLSTEVVSAHAGGSATELLTVYAIVNAVTANLPAVQRVQILVEGREVDTLAGHVDLRRPLERDLSLVRDPASAPN